MTSNDIKTPPEIALGLALAHLGMIAQAANGLYKPRPGEIDNRQAWLINYIRNGEARGSEESLDLARKIGEIIAGGEGGGMATPEAA